MRSRAAAEAVVGISLNATQLGENRRILRVSWTSQKEQLEKWKRSFNSITSFGALDWVARNCQIYFLTSCLEHFAQGLVHFHKFQSHSARFHKIKSNEGKVSTHFFYSNYIVPSNIDILMEHRMTCLQRVNFTLFSTVHIKASCQISLSDFFKFKNNQLDLNSNRGQVLVSLWESETESGHFFSWLPTVKEEGCILFSTLPYLDQWRDVFEDFETQRSWRNRQSSCRSHLCWGGFLTAGY